MDFPLTGAPFHDRYRTVPETRIVDMLMLAGWAYALGEPTMVARTHEAIEDWVEQGLPFRRTETGSRLFDPAEVWAIMKRLGREEANSYFREGQMMTWRRMVEDHAIVSADNAFFSLELHRTFALSDVPEGRALRLRLPVPIASAHGDRGVTLLGDAGEQGAAVHANRIELRAVAGGRPLTLAARFDISAPVPTTIDEDKSLYLRPREGLIGVSDRVGHLAGRLAGPGASVAQAVRSFWIFLIEAFICAPIHYDQVDPASPCDHVLETGFYDCQLGAALFVALCRASDIPAKLVGGHFLYRRAPTNHYWAEYWCPEGGWTPVDFLGWDLSCGGRDPEWRDRFFGRLDARLITQRLPLEFPGAPGVSVPPAWHLLQTASRAGVDIALTALDGRPVYTDFVRMLDPQSG